MKTLVATLLAALALSACAVANYQTLKLGHVDPAKKSITVPGAGPALFEIKAALLTEGWKVKVGDAALREIGRNSATIDTTTTLRFDTGYRLYMDSTMSTNDNHGITTFNISIVDNQSNEEVLNMVGNRQDHVRYRPQDIAANLVSALKELQK